MTISTRWNPIRMAVGKVRAAAKGQLFAAPDVWLFQWAHNMLSVGGHRLPPVPDVHNGRDLWATRQGSLDPAPAVMRMFQTKPATGSHSMQSGNPVITTRTEHRPAATGQGSDA